MHRLLLVSFDAVGDDALPRLLGLPHFAALAAASRVTRGVASLFLSNTYPVHASVVTGLPQHRHGLVSNTAPFPHRHPRWWYEASRIRARTLWQAAAEKGLVSAAVLWPATGGAKEIAFNIPELMALPGQNQVLLNLRYGTKLLQLGMLLKYRRLLRGIAQPARDAFATACMADILRRKRPHLALMHLTAYDSLCHRHGLHAPETKAALASLDENLGLLLRAAGPDCSVILFSDHSQLPAETPVLPNEMLHAGGLLPRDAGGHYLENDAPGCFFECCGGSAFFHPGRLSPKEVAAVRRQAEQLPGFSRFLRSDELHACGRGRLPFGFAARAGYACEAYPSGNKADHGYPPDMPGYGVFYLVRHPAFPPARRSGGSLLDIAPLAAGILGLNWPGAPG